MDTSFMDFSYFVIMFMVALVAGLLTWCRAAVVFSLLALS